MITSHHISSLHKRISLTTFLIAVFVSILTLAIWIRHDPTQQFDVLLPGADGYNPAVLSLSRADVNIGSVWNLIDSSSVSPSGSWPGFRGPKRDNLSESRLILGGSSDASPEELWSIDLGEGHAGAAVHNGRVYIMDYDEDQKADILRCFALEDGRELWSRGYAIPIKRNHGISRTVPAVNDSFVVSIGPRCHVMCLNAVTGKFKWGLDLVKDFGAEVPFWYTGQCPLLDGNTAVLAVGGKEILMMGVDCQSGDILWQTPNPNQWKMSHASVMPINILGKDQYCYSSIGGVLGVSADGQDAGQLLWDSKLWSHSVIAPSPIQLGANRIFLTAGYSAGSMVMEISIRDDQYYADSLFTIRPDKGLASEQQTPIQIGETVCGILPKDGGALKEQFVCYPVSDLTTPVWSSGKSNRYGLGPYMIARNYILILDDEGTLTILDSKQDQYNEIAKFELLDGHDAWAPMAVVDGRLLLRDSKTMKCFQLDSQLQLGVGK